MQNVERNPVCLCAKLAIWAGVAASLAFTASGQVLLTEFMAGNSSTLRDQDGEYSDWIEVYNESGTNVDLLNWSLADSPDNLTKWRFPSTNLPPKHYLVVFASNKDRRTPGGELHANFKLDAAGEYLALVRPDGSIATQFAPKFPPQTADVAYGLAASVQRVTLVTTGAVGRVRVPADGALGTAWTTNGFNDATWTRATNGIGFETGASELGASLVEDVLADSPVGYWRLNGPTYTTMTNSGTLGAAANGTWNGDVQLGQAGAIAGDSNASMRSTGTAGEKATVPFSAALNPSTSFSVEFWMKSELASGSALAPFYSRCGDDGYIIYIQGDASLQFLQWTGTTYGWQAASTGANTVRGLTNKWVHVVGVFNSGVGAYGTQYIYTNGVLAGTNALPGAFRNNTCGSFLIGYRNYQGGLDETAVYGGALSAARVLAHYQAGTNGLGSYTATVGADAPLAWWRFGEPAFPPSPGMTANAGSLGPPGDGTLSGGVTSSAGPMTPPAWPGLEANNTCAAFSGGQMTVPYNAALNPAKFTVEFWARCTGNPGNYRGVMCHNWTSSDYKRRIGWNCLANSGNFWEFNVADGADFSGVVGPPVVLGEWIHLAATHDGTQLVLYANGAAVGTNVTAFQPDTNSASMLRLGSATPWDSTWLMYFPGDLDEVALFDRALSAEDIARRYQVARSGKVAGALFYTGLIRTDLQSAMLGNNASACFRLPFAITNLAGLSDLKLRLKYDDGFVAWLNGVPVASVNAPDAVDWNAAAVARSHTADALQFEEFDLSPWRSALLSGTNILALQGLNYGATNTDFLLLAEIEADYAGAYGTNAVFLLSPTPGSLNGSGSAAPGPGISLAGHVPAAPTTNDDLVVTCRVSPVLAPIASVTLNWRVMFGATNQAPMYDDGLHGDGAAGDGIFGAVIGRANYTRGQMVRWFVTASDTADRRSRWPLFLDPLNSPEYLGTMIADPSVVSAIPVWYWFAADTSAAHTRAGARVSVFFNGEFYDNVFARERGQSAASGAQKFDFNSGYHCWINDEVGRVEELNLNTQGYADGSYTRPPVAFDTYRSAGNPASACFHMLLRANGGADRVGVFVEQVDERLLERWGLDRAGALYKFVNRITLTPMLSDPIDGVEKKTRLDEDRSDLQAMCNALQQTNNIEARAAWMFDNLDLAAFANGLAARVVACNTDDRRKNMYFYRDTLGTREWRFIPWDQDWTFGLYGDGNNTHPFYSDHAHAGGANNEQWSYHYEALYNDPRTRQMIVRRMRTVMDQLLQPPGTLNGRLESRVDFYYTNSTAAKTLGGLSVDSAVVALKTQFPGRRTALYVTYAATNGASGLNALIPESQPTSLFLGIGVIEFNPASGNQDEEYVQIVNTNRIAVDISGWKLGGGVSHIFEPGTVILASNVMYCTPNVVAFRARGASPRGGERLFVQGNYEGHLSAWGEDLTLTDDRGRLVATNGFAPAPSDVQRYLRVTEIMYNPSAAPAINSDAQQFEYVELRNVSPDVTLNLANVRFTNGIAFNFTGSAVTSLSPGARALIVRNLAAFSARYGAGLPVAGQYTGALDNAGETLRLEDAGGEKVLEFAYNNSWYPITDGLGFSLVIVNDQAHWSTWGQKSSWRSSGTLGGAPGLADTPLGIGGLLVNEVLAHTDSPQVDAIELFNDSPTNLNIGGWFLTDDFYNPKKYCIPAGTTIASGHFATFTAAQFNTGANAFLLSEYGDQVYLFSADANTNLTGYVHGFDFPESPNGVSFGRYVNSQTNTLFVLQSTNSLNGTNALPRVGPIVISEIMYDPPGLTNGADNDLEEFIELQNITGTNVPLFCVFTNEAGYGPAALTNTWRLRDAVDFDFPTNVTLAPGGRVLVVGFSPTNAALANAFRTRYTVPAAVNLYGPWSGKLDDSGETIELKYPDKPDVTSSNIIVPYVMVEKVSYQDSGAWPTNADGLGDSLQRLTLGAFSNDPTNWFASTPTGGRANYLNQPPIVTLTSPAAGAVFQLPTNILLTATASDPDGVVLKVEFYDDTVKLGEALAAPYSLVWSNPPAGPHRMQARAVDDSGASTSSSIAMISVMTIPPFVELTSPADGSVLVAGQDLNVAATASDADGSISRVQFFTNGVAFAETLAPPYWATQSNLAPGLYLLSAVATDNSGDVSTSAVVRVAFGTGKITNASLVATGSVWSYFDKGSLPATNWYTAAYSDAAWSKGPAQLGYGNTNDATPVSYGGNGSAKYPTTYFRRAFLVTNATEITSLTALLKRDDGAVFYLNGVEAFRAGMPSGDVTYDTWASETVGGVTKYAFTTNSVPPALLREGTNLVAVEIHQVNPTSSDILFELQLDGLRSKAGPFIASNPTNLTVATGGTATFGADVLGPAPLTYEWRHNGTRLPGRTVNPLVLTGVTSPDAGTYSVVASNPNGSVTSSDALLVVQSVDADGDGMPDVWEETNGLDPAVNDASLDPDQDGASNIEEYWAGTSPTNSASVFRIEVVDFLDPARFSFTFTAIAQHTYSVQSRSNLVLGDWAPWLDLSAAPTNRVVILTNAIGGGARFFRIVTSPIP